MQKFLLLGTIWNEEHVKPVKKTIEIKGGKVQFSKQTLVLSLENVIENRVHFTHAASRSFLYQVYKSLQINFSRW